jgi:type III secretion protein Q
MSTDPHTAAPPASLMLAKVDVRTANRSRWLHDRRFARAWGTDVHIAPVEGAPAGQVHCLQMRGGADFVELLIAADNHAALDFASGDAETADDPLMAIAAMAWCDAASDGARALGLESLRPVALFRTEGRGRRIPRDGWSEVRDGDRALFAVHVLELPQRLELEIAARIVAFGGDGRLRRSLALHGAVTLARRDVARRLLTSLEPGDVLLLDPSDGQLPAAACRLRWGLPHGRHWSAAVQVGDDRITIDGDIRMNDLQETASPRTDGPPSLDALELPVRFEVDTVSITLGEIEAMAPGQVIALTTPLAGSHLRIVACGQAVGTAELVAVGDRLGARILHMVDTHELARD